MRKATIVVLAGFLAGCTATIPGNPMPDAFRDLKQAISDRELKDAGYTQKSDRWVAGNLHVVVNDGKIVQIGNEAEGLVCDFNEFKTAHLSLVSAAAVFKMSLEAKAALQINKPSRDLPIAHKETGNPVLTVSCLRSK